MKRLLFPLLMLLSWHPIHALAANLTVNWSVPIACSDGSALSNCPIVKWDIWTATCSATNVPPSPFSGAPAASVPVGPLTFTFANTPAGTWCATVAGETTNGQLSQQSNVAVAVLGTVAPGAPSVTIPPATSLKTTGTAVFLATNIPNGFGFTQLGTVPVGSPCIGGEGADAYNSVDQTKVTVTWSTAIHAINVVALCTAQ